MKNFIVFTLIIVLMSGCYAEKKPPKDFITENINNAITQKTLQVNAINEKKATLNPRTFKNGKTIYVPFNDWTSGFFPGSMWQMYVLTNEEKWLELAKKHTEALDSVQYLTTTHDVGFMVGCSYLNGYRQGKSEYEGIIIQAARSLITRFRPNAGVIQSWDTDKGWMASRGWKCPVIIDNMMNLELLFEATRISNDSSFHKIAVSHANKTLENHFRYDHSSYHVVDYNPDTGEIRSKKTAQGYNDESSWARGQAWALYGYTMCFRYTHDKRYAEQAEHIYDFIFSNENMPEDLVPYWDYDALNIPNEPRDASSAAIVASALYELNGYTGRIRNTFQQNNFKIDVSSSFSNSIRSGMNPSVSTYSGMNNLFYSVWGYRPVTQPSLPLSTLLDNITDESVNQTADYRFNPILSLNNEYRKNIIDYAQHNASAEYEFMKGLKLKVSGTYTTDKRRSEMFNNSKTRGGSSISTNKVNATLIEDQRVNWLNENIISYQTTLKSDHNISTLAGTTFQNLSNKYNSIMTKNIPNEDLGMAGMAAGDAGDIRSSISEWSLLSYLGRINYNYQSKYYLTASIRVDGSSKFRKGNRWGYFPSFSGAWTFSKEPFMRKFSTLSNGKIRASWGQTGNNRVGYYDSYAMLSILYNGERDYSSPNGITHGVYPFGNDVNSVGTIPYTLPNQDLKWETTTQTNIGLDLSFLKEKIQLTIDGYDKITSDLLLRASLVPSSGYGSAIKNIGKIQNRGLEFTIKATVMKKKAFSWDANFNIAFNQNRVLELAENQTSLLTTAHFDQNFTSPNYIAKINYPMGMMYGYVYEGVYAISDFDKSGTVYSLKPGIPYYTSENNTQPGYPKYADLNKDGIIDSKDQTIIGRGDPIHIGGFSNNFKYKRFDLNLFFQWTYGNDILNANRLMFESSFSRRKDLNQFASYSNRWTFDNQSSVIPRVNSSASSQVFSSRVIEDGSYIRLKTLSFGYNFDSKVIRKIGIQKARVYVSGQNLFTLTKYSGYDPEVSVRDTPLSPGLDFSAYPRAISYNFGLNVSF